MSVIDVGGEVREGEELDIGAVNDAEPDSNRTF